MLVCASARALFSCVHADMAYQDPRLEGAYQGAPIDSDSHQVGSLYPRDAGDASAHVADGAEPDRVGAQFQFVPTVMAVPENESPYAKALREFNEQQMMYDDAPRPKYQKEEEFLRLLLTIEGKALSKELFKFLFDLVRLMRGKMTWRDMR